MTKTRKRFSAEEKAAIVRRHLVDGASVADLADEFGIAPTQFYRWQQQAISGMVVAFERKRDGAEKRLEQENEALRRTIARKDEVIAEVTGELIDAKKKTGGLS